LCRTQNRSGTREEKRREEKRREEKRREEKRILDFAGTPTSTLLSPSL
jgi:hypothetical protein